MSVLETPTIQIREEIAFQKATVARLKRDILGVDQNSRRRYIREFHEDFKRYVEVSSLDDLSIACFKADIVYIGDYHALPASQAFAARLLRDVAARSREVVLCVEMVFGRNQRTLDRFMRGEIGEVEFLKAIRYDMEWGYDWNSFRRLFLAARAHNVPAFGIDCGPRAGCRNIRRRDGYAAARIVDLIESRPEAKVVVVIGESHLARRHLPLKVSDRLKRRGMQRRGVIVLQNLDDIYWSLAEQGLQHVDVVSLGPDAFCHFNTSPIAKYEAYRHVLEVWKGDAVDDGQVDLTSTVHSMIDTILNFLRVNKYTHCVRRETRCREFLVDVYPEVYSGLEVEDLKTRLREARFTAAEIAEVLGHVGRSGSCYVPRVNAIFIGRFNMVHAGEEAAHFVNLVLKGEIYGGAPVSMAQHDLFYSGVMEEALGFFGSKLIDPSRNHFFETAFYQYYRKDRRTIETMTPYTYEEFNEIISFILLHKRFEQSYGQYDEVPAAILEGIRAEPKRANVLIHELGYFLGQQVYDAHRAGIVSRGRIRGFFRASYRETGSALGAYLDLTKTVGKDSRGAPAAPAAS